jgi:hypothetical protein
MFSIGKRLAALEAALVTCDQFEIMVDKDPAIVDANDDLLPGQGIGHGVEVLQDADVDVVPDATLGPQSERVWIGQWTPTLQRKQVFGPAAGYRVFAVVYSAMC